MSEVSDEMVDAAWQAFKPCQHGTDRYKREGLRAAITAANPLTDPDCPQSVRDQINGATHPTSQAIEKAREIAAMIAKSTMAAAWFDLGMSENTASTLSKMIEDSATKHLSEALSVSASEREALEARVKELEAALKPFAEFIDFVEVTPFVNWDDDAKLVASDPSEPNSEKSAVITGANFRAARAALNGAKRP